MAQLARGVGVDARAAARYVDLLADLLLRRLPAWSANVGKRLVTSPRVYLRDSGIVHALLGIEDYEGLLPHPVVGASWEGFVVENALASAPDDTGAYLDAQLRRASGFAFYNTASFVPASTQSRRRSTVRRRRRGTSSCGAVAGR